MSAALKLVPETEDLSKKPRLGKKVTKPRLVWENPALTGETQKGKLKAKPDASYGRVLYNYFRYYDPSLGRYLTADKLDVLHRANDPSLTVAADTGLISLPMDGVGSFEFEGEKYNYTAAVVSTVGLNHSYGYVNQNPINDIDVNGLNPARAAFAVAMAAAKAMKKQIEKGADFCKSIRCKIENHGAHHRFGFPFNERRKHIQLTCWRKGVKGSTFIMRFPY